MKRASSFYCVKSSGRCTYFLRAYGQGSACCASDRSLYPSWYGQGSACAHVHGHGMYETITTSSQVGLSASLV